MIYAAVYTDEGPKGIGAQACSITRPWLEVHLFVTEFQARDYIAAMGVFDGRKRPQWRLATPGDKDGFDELSDHREATR
jgi:hypothetical protein